MGEVVIRTFGGVFEAQPEKYDVNGSESMSTKVSGAMNALSVGAVFGSLEPSIGRQVENSKQYSASVVDQRSIRKGQTPFGCQGSWGRSGPTFTEAETNVV